ncbi:MAG: hypothetical protein Q7S14_01615 [bacterium]|nr:hypothetical protein [bacterium]
MRLIFNTPNLNPKSPGSYIFVDDEFKKITSQGSILVDPLVSFEPFGRVINHQEIFSKIQENALLLSKIYAHQNNSCTSSFVDLFLAGRLMLNWSNSLLVTGNKKDFPSVIFDTFGVINVEQKGDGSMRAYTLLSFNPEKFTKCFNLLKNLDKNNG